MLSAPLFNLDVHIFNQFSTRNVFPACQGVPDGCLVDFRRLCDQECFRQLLFVGDGDGFALPPADGEFRSLDLFTVEDVGKVDFQLYGLVFCSLLPLVKGFR
ncbi:hypothetical protein, partial [Megasphaera sp.]|uniref:hypothetical protein n=1 Tax=Megasphaera sp. TaxID=2023260 RepID=UPI0040258B95